VDFIHPILESEQTPFCPTQISQWFHFATAQRANRVAWSAALVRKIRLSTFVTPESFLIDFLHIQFI
jgi:hypothetical protein